MQDTLNFIAVSRPQLSTLQQLLHEAIKGDIEHMPYLNKIWQHLDSALAEIDSLTMQLDIEKNRFLLLNRSRGEQMDHYYQTMGEPQ